MGDVDSSRACSPAYAKWRVVEALWGISQKVLTQTLRPLERNGLIQRLELAKKPAHVEYRLTLVACSLVDTLAALDRWAEHHFPELDAA